MVTWDGPFNYADYGDEFYELIIDEQYSLFWEECFNNWKDKNFSLSD